jgi:hypothetical protein
MRGIVRGELRDELRQRALRVGRARLARQCAHAAPVRRSSDASWPRRYSDAGIAQALELVAQGKTLREAGATVGASHATVMRWLKNVA